MTCDAKFMIIVPCYSLTNYKNDNSYYISKYFVEEFISKESNNDLPRGEEDNVGGNVKKLLATEEKKAR